MPTIDLDDLRLSLVDMLEEDDVRHEYLGITFQALVGDDELGLRMACPIAHPMAEKLLQLAYDVCTEAYSNSTNNDACDVTVRERTAHLDSHQDLDGWHHDTFHVIVDVHILDALS